MSTHWQYSDNIFTILLAVSSNFPLGHLQISTTRVRIMGRILRGPLLNFREGDGRTVSIPPAEECSI